LHGHFQTLIIAEILEEIMAFAEVGSLKDHVGEEVTVRGWLYNKRKGGSIRFLLVRDGTGIVQCIMSKGDLPDDVFDLYGKLTQESSLKVTGTVREDPRSPGGCELLVSRIEPVQIADPYPITPKEHGIEFLLDHRHLWLRSSRQHAILRVRHEVIRAIRNYYDSRGYVLIDSPIITPAAAEGTTTLFPTDYFGNTAYLTQSGQLYLEPACMSFGKVYCFGPTFRAEKSKTRRHLTEFWMVEPEVAWMEIDELMELCEDFVYEITARVLENCRSELETLERDIGKLEKALKRPYPRMTYTETIEKLQAAGSEIQWGSDFGAADETLLTRDLDQPLLVHRWPAAIKAFYMEPDPEDDRLILGVDVQAPEGYGELIGGSQRIGSPDKLIEKIKEHNLPEAAYRWYIEIRRFGGVPHSGFGLGVERTVTWLCGIRHIRETIPYPRTLNRIYP
jgi:asparaginyl-tRNA synthetase